MGKLSLAGEVWLFLRQNKKLWLLPIVIVLGGLLFDETLDRWTMIGAGIILAANAYIAHREAVLARRSASEAPSAAAKPGE